MPHQKRNFIEGEYYHITLRRMGGELMFVDETDFYRGIFSLYEFNDANAVSIRKRRQERRGRLSAEETEGRPRPLPSRDKLVEVVSFCLMPNHLHLLLTSIKEDGITQYMSKLASGYASYFKNRHEFRTKGHFYQDRFHAVHVGTNAQLKAVFAYIHTNPVSLIYPGWKQGGELNVEEAMEYLESYKWSSLLDYLEIKNFPSVTQRDFMKGIVGSPQECRRQLKEWLEHKEDIVADHEGLFIE